ncbi:hypothetical protein [Microbacterium jejuense]|uniref:hypothetical protein n=1 Tax=Microbacterium jejuense TaxID=1263637 RepID=UPI0031E6995C
MVARAATAAMVFFRTGREQLFLALSDDALDPGRAPTFRAVRRGEPVYAPSAGTIRDPALSPHRLGDGYWYVLHTRLSGEGVSYNSATGPVLGFLRSRNLVDWEPVGTGMLAVGAVRFTHCWAPKWFVDRDDGIHVIFSAATGPDHAPTPFGFFEMHPLTDDPAGAWSPPRPLTGRLPVDRLDAYLVREDDGRYACVYKNRVTHTLELAHAPALHGPYAVTAAWDHWGLQEGPVLLRLADRRWRLFFDWPDNTPENYRFADSTGRDLAATRWLGPRGEWGLVDAGGQELRHGTIVALEADDAAVVRDAIAASDSVGGQPS